jgi:hypothetical protein
MTNFSGAELQVEDAEQDICHRRKHRKKIGILSSEAGQKMSRRNKAVQRPAKPAEAAAKSSVAEKESHCRFLPSEEARAAWIAASGLGR